MRDVLRKELDEVKVSHRTVGEYYQMLIDERCAELNDFPETAKWSKPMVTKHRTTLRRLSNFRKQLYFEDITVELLEKFETHLIGQDELGAIAAAKYIDRLPKTRQPEFYDLMVKTQAWKH